MRRRGARSADVERRARSLGARPDVRRLRGRPRLDRTQERPLQHQSCSRKREGLHGFGGRVRRTHAGWEGSLPARLGSVPVPANTTPPGSRSRPGSGVGSGFTTIIKRSPGPCAGPFPSYQRGLTATERTLRPPALMRCIAQGPPEMLLVTMETTPSPAPSATYDQVRAARYDGDAGGHPARESHRARMPGSCGAPAPVEADIEHQQFRSGGHERRHRRARRRGRLDVEVVVDGIAPRSRRWCGRRRRGEGSPSAPRPG